MNRRLCRILVILLSVLAAFPALFFAQGPPVGRSVVISLEPGEEIMWAESLISVSAALDKVILVLSKGAEGPFFVFREGKKQGPFAGLKEAMAKAYEGREESAGKRRDCAKYTPGPAPAEGQPTISSEGNSGQTIQYGGKTFGPYQILLANKVTPDGARMYFTAANKDKAWFGCSDGRQVSFGGIPVDFVFSPDGKNAAAVCEGTASMAEMENMGKLPPDKLSAALLEMDKRFVYTIDGQKFGPFGKDFSSSDIWFPAVSNDIYFKVDDQVYRNGTHFLKIDSLDPCAFYPSPDGKAYALFTYENIVFSDGMKYPSPLDIAVFSENGKTVFKWIFLENNKDLVIYRRPM